MAVKELEFKGISQTGQPAPGAIFVPSWQPGARQSFRLPRPMAPGVGLAVLVGVYLVLMPNVKLLPQIQPYDAKRLFQVLILLITGGWLLVSSVGRRVWLDTFSSLPVLAQRGLLVLLGLGCVSSLFAPLPQFAFLEIGHLVLLFCLTVAFAGFSRRAPEVAQTVLLSGLTLSVFFYFVSFLVGYTYGVLDEPPSVWPERAYFGFSHVRFLNQVQTWTLPLIVLPAVVVPVRLRFIRWTLMALASAWWMLLFATGGRGTSVATGVALLVVLIIFRRHAFSWLRLQSIALLSGALLYGFFFKVLVSSNVSLLERSVTNATGRWVFWERAWDLIAAHPLLGAGPMHYADSVTELAAHPHNAVLQWAAEWGVPAAVFAVGLVVWGLLACFRSYRRTVEHPDQITRQVLVRVAVTASLVAAAVHALFSGIIVMPLSQLLMAAIVGWAWGLCGWSEAARASKMGYRRLLCSVVGAALAATVWGVAPGAVALNEKQAAYIDKVQPDALRPRFWQQGYISYP